MSPVLNRNRKWVMLPRLGMLVLRGLCFGEGLLLSSFLLHSKSQKLILTGREVKQGWELKHQVLQMPHTG